MNFKSNRRVLILSLLLAGVSAIVAYYLIASRPQPAPTIVEAAPVSGEPVLVAARALPAGVTLSEDDLEVAYVTSDTKNPRTLTTSEQAIGEVTLVALPKGEQIVSDAIGVAPTPAPQTYARDVPVGMRAVTIASEETVGVAGFVQPGDRVDVIAGFELKPVRPGDTVEKRLGLGGNFEQEQSDESAQSDDSDDSDGSEDDSDDNADDNNDSEDDAFPMAELLVQDVEVLAVGQALEGEIGPSTATDPSAPAPADASADPAAHPEATSVTLLVDPTQALRLLLAVQAEGTFRLLLRAPGDATVTELPPALITSGQMPMAPIKLVGANLPVNDLVITDARFRQTTIPGGGVLEFEATVRNASSHLIPAGRGGAEPGYVYHEGENWRSLPNSAPDGVYSLAITSANAASQTFPWRWDLGKDLAPGETATISGGIQVPNTAGSQEWWFGIVLQPGTVLEDGVASAQITIEPVTSVVAIAPEVEVRAAPWPDADIVTSKARGASLDVIDEQDGWFQVRSGDQEGWVPEAAVANAALPEAAAVQKEERAS